MFSHNELRHIMENAFVPTLCKCTIHADDTMTLELFNPETRAPELQVDDISIAKLTGGRALAALVRDVKEEAARQKAAESEPVKRRG